MFRYVRARRGGFIAVMALAVVSTVLLSGGNILTQRLVDAVMARDMAGVRLYILASLGYALLSGAVFVVSSVSQDVFGAKLMNDMRLSVFDGIMRRGRADFAANHTADYVSAMTNDLHTIRAQFNILYLVTIAVVSMTAGAAIMFWYQPVIALCTVCSAFAMTAAPWILGRVIGKWQKKRSEKMAALTAMLSECFAGFETIATFGIQRHIRKRFAQRSEELRDCEYRSGGIEELSNGLSQLLSVLAQTLVFSLACWLVFTERMSVGAMMVFSSLNTTFCSNLTMFLQGVPMLKGARPVVERINGYADYQGEESAGHAEPSFNDSVAIQNLCFGYSAGDSVLKNLSLTLRRGGKYALTGESGSGKSTLIHLLLGDYADYGGGIYYDGTEMRELQRAKLNQVAACIHQDVFLFDDTIYNNICLFEEFSDEQFAWAVRASGVQKFMEGLPEGASYAVGERGERLSGGQRQRIAIARALIRNAKFLILDEGTSALDNQTAMEIEEGLMELKEMTLLTITHHLRNPKQYDAIFVLRDGAVEGAA